MSDTLSSQDRQALEELIDGCQEALDAEIEAVQLQLRERGLDDPIPVQAARSEDASGGSFFYKFKIGGGPYDIRPDDAVRIRHDDREATGFVAQFKRREGLVRVASSEWLGRRPVPAELEFDPTWLLEALKERLSHLREAPEEFHPETTLHLFGRSFPELGREEPQLEASEQLNASQRDALERLLGSEAHFIWGPPGTGKTLLLGDAVGELAHRGKTLVATTTNGALDEAAARAARVMGEQAVQQGEIIRVGAEYSTTGAEELGLDEVLDRRVKRSCQDLLEAIEELERELMTPSQRRKANGHIRRRHGRLVALAQSKGDKDLLGRLRGIGEALQAEQLEALQEARVVLSTLARLTLWDELAELRFENLVIDEASTSSLPYLVWATALARKRAVAIGDFQQLPSVVTATSEPAQRWMMRDIFREAEVVREQMGGEVELPSSNDQLVAMLTEQYRMSPPIRRLVSDLFYGGRLEDAPEVLERGGPQHPLVLLDTGPLDPRVEQAEGSRGNATHRQVILDLLQQASARGIDDVGVVVPYRIQARRLRKLVYSKLGGAAPRDLEISTVHSFQGREKSMVIFDTVDSPPVSSWFLHEGKNRDFPRLLNVALSRTRDMLVVVANVEGLQKTLPDQALLNQVIHRIQREATDWSAEKLDQLDELF